ncbi:MAG: hypothetical protein MZV49_18470 [Rhodopseudomonas palustris]|nr:hypothetical protein [Rhodopseudomonas palustris]
MVDSLFLNPLPMVLGAMSPAIAAAVIGAVTDDVVIWLCVLPFLALGGVRALSDVSLQAAAGSADRRRSRSLGK